MLTGNVIPSVTKQSLNTGRLLRYTRNDVLLLLIFCLTLSLLGQSRSGITTPGDSTKNKYDINDSRNPHCPCHQYQKLADKEYDKLQKKEGNLIVATNSNRISLNNATTKKHCYTFIKYKRKHTCKRFYKVKVMFSKEYRKKWKTSSVVTNCFDW